MKTFLSTLAALLVAGIIAFVVWKHEVWVAAKNASIALMNSSSGAISVAGARDCVGVFNAKILPLSASDRYWLTRANAIIEADEFNSAYSYFVLELRASMAASLCEEEGERFLSAWGKTGRLTDQRRKMIEEAVRRFAREKREAHVY